MTVLHSLYRGWGRDHDYYALAMIRGSRRIKGEYEIQISDMMNDRTYSDLICVHKTYMDGRGYFTSNDAFAGLAFTSYSSQRPENIPLRALMPKGIEGLLVIGKAKSMSCDVATTLRMQPDLMNEGYGAGYAAALSAKTNTPFRQLDFGPIHSHLASTGMISDKTEYRQDMVQPTDEEFRAAANGLDAGTAGWEKNRAVFLQWPKEGGTVLAASFAASPSLQKAKLLGLIGHKASESYLIDWLGKQSIPAGKPGDTYAAYPDFDGVTRALGTIRSSSAAPVLAKHLNSLSGAADQFSHIYTLCAALREIASPDASSALKAFLDKNNGNVKYASSEKAAGIPEYYAAAQELYAAAALYTCGDIDNAGKTTLETYLDDWRGPLARYAGDALGVAPAGPVNKRAARPVSNCQQATRISLRKTRSGLNVRILESREYSLDMLSLNGAKVYSVTGNAPGDFYISTAQFRPGTYVVRMLAGDQMQAMKVVLER